MSFAPARTCPRCRTEVGFPTVTCPACGQVLGLGADGLTAGERAKAGLCTIAGGVLAFLGSMMALVDVAMAISGPAPQDRAQYANGGWSSVVLMCLAIFVLPPLASGLALLWNARNIRRKGKTLAPPVVAPLTAADPVTQVEREIRRLLKLLTGPYREAASRLAKELDELLRRHREMEGRLTTLNEMALSLPGAELDGQRATLHLRLETERDELIVASLRKQLQGIEGQIEARESVETSCARLKAARDASLNALLCLRAELLALSASASDRGREALEAETGDLQELHSELQQTRLAAEEVLRISQG